MLLAFPTSTRSMPLSNYGAPPLQFVRISAVTPAARLPQHNACDTVPVAGQLRQYVRDSTPAAGQLQQNVHDSMLTAGQLH
ncbi:hypothetical protein K438DRAFT_1972357 [Mycena galopus ATCC 62051]|nr:hypothetical protein K438DRAFT_1972357 [Mycena galopus ATCC 62051]